MAVLGVFAYASVAAMLPFDDPLSPDNRQSPGSRKSAAEHRLYPRRRPWLDRCRLPGLEVLRNAAYRQARSARLAADQFLPLAELRSDAGRPDERTVCAAHQRL